MGAIQRHAAHAATFVFAAGMALTAGTPAFADAPGGINAADTAWMIVATAFVLMMTIP
ncbi:MAG: ammonia channel protein, partial [Proteobacteria bacterium]|nr:ammonia channel protein [Pseudomonadota bacterium]